MINNTDKLHIEAQEFLQKMKDSEYKNFISSFSDLPDEVQDIVQQIKYKEHRQEMDKYFIPENASIETREEYFFPSNILPLKPTYKLVITSYQTKKGSWSYTQGLVYRIDEDKPIFEVRRNYCSFPFAWIEGHKNGHTYLICGEDYQGTTVLELNTGKRRDYIPRNEAMGIGFCGQGFRFDADTSILTVCGCVWACPYEFRLYDFSDPISTLPEIEPEDTYISEDGKWPTFESDGTIKIYDTWSDDDDEEDDDETEKPIVIKSIKTFRRDDLKLILIDEWASDEEKDRCKKREEANIKYEQKIKEFKASDPLYLAYLELVKDSALSPENSEGVGITYKGWCPDFELEEQRWCRRIIECEGHKGYTIDLEWATTSGPIKLVIFKDGKYIEDKWFEHSVAGMNQAFTYAKYIGTKS